MKYRLDDPKSPRDGRPSASQRKSQQIQQEGKYSDFEKLY